MLPVGNRDPRTESVAVPSMPRTGSVYHVPCAQPPARRPRADPYVSPGAPGQVFRRRGRRWRARRPTCRRTRLPYESRLPRAAVASGRQRLSKQFGWPMLARMSVRVGSINSRGRPRPGGQERRAVAKRDCWAGLRHQTEPPGCATTDAEPGSSCRRGGGSAYTQLPAVPLAGAIGAAVPEHAPPLRGFGRLPRCEPGVSRRPHTRELLCTPASSGAWSTRRVGLSQPAGWRVVVECEEGRAAGGGGGPRRDEDAAACPCSSSSRLPSSHASPACPPYDRTTCSLFWISHLLPAPRTPPLSRAQRDRHFAPHPTPSAQCARATCQRRPHNTPTLRPRRLHTPRTSPAPLPPHAAAPGRHTAAHARDIRCVGRNNTPFHGIKALPAPSPCGA